MQKQHIQKPAEKNSMNNPPKVSRSLTAGEIRMARSIYKSSIDYNRVKIHDFPYFTQFAGTPMQTPDDKNIYTRPISPYLAE